MICILLSKLRTHLLLNTFFSRAKLVDTAQVEGAPTESAAREESKDNEVKGSNVNVAAGAAAASAAAIAPAAPIGKEIALLEPPKEAM